MNGCIKNSHRTYNHRTYTSVCLSALICLLLPGTASGRNDIGVTEPTVAEPAFSAKAALPAEMDLTVTTIPFNTQSYDGIYTLGGVRLKLTLNQSSLSTEDQTDIPNIIWTFGQAGRICTDMNMLADNSNCQVLPLGFDYQRADNTATTENEQFTVFWEPLDWTLGMNVIATARTDNGDRVVTAESHGTTLTVPYPESRFELLLSTRTLGPAADGEEPTEGSDVKMLEQMLWQLGVSPSASPGTSGIRLAENKRDTFKTGNNSIGKMVGRFNYFSHSPINQITEEQGFINQTANGIAYITIDDLKKHWSHYMQAYSAPDYNMSSKQSFTYSDILQADKDAAEAVFNGVVSYPRGVTINGIDATYTAELHNRVSRYGSFSRSDILKAMAQRESGGEHWGDGDHYRVKVGGADEAGSKGFNQIQNKYTYGGLSLDGTGAGGTAIQVAQARNNICSPVSAYTAEGQSQVNHYDPGQNLVAKAVWLAGIQGNCGRSFRRAFHDNSYTGIYQSPPESTLLAMVTGSEREAIESGNHVDDTYELLTKGIGAYNQGAGVFSGGNGNAWVNLLTSQMTPTSTEFRALVARGYRSLTDAEKLDYGRTQGMVYGMAVMHDADKLNLPHRQYIWQGGTYPADLTDTAGNPDPRAGLAWCFGYGESEWLSGTTYDQARQNASDTDARGNPHTPQGRIDCTTGNPI